MLKEEYEILKGLDGRWKWIARDDENRIYSAEVHVFEMKPEREDGYWNNISNGEYELLRERDDLFQFIQWEDSEPYNIQELIEDFEEAKRINEIFRDSLHKALDKAEESEGTEVKKDIEWAQKEVDRYLSYEGVNEARNALTFAKGVINQLDEPEVLMHEITYEDALKVIAENIDTDEFSIGLYLEALSNNEKYEFLTEKWIEDNTSPVDEEGRLYVWKRDLQNVIVPKQELPVIPKFVADWIEKCKNFVDYDGSTIDLFTSLHEAQNETSLINTVHYHKRIEVYDWVADNPDVYAQAWLAYPNIEAEEEQKYYVLSKELYPMLCESAGADKNIMESTTQLTINEKGLYKEQYALTEQEIKDYDPRFWPFAVKVEELEE